MDKNKNSNHNHIRSRQLEKSDQNHLNLMETDEIEML